ncbi:MAG: hypothetical protein JXQ83_11025 [Candidatus Glassbacteria bacterium]|nr:hypothetical protein [Candidatus Glassbacteria bacterium]
MSVGVRDLTVVRAAIHAVTHHDQAGEIVLVQQPRAPGEADLVITGFSLRKMQKDGGEFMMGFGKIKDILFVRSGQEILIVEKLK